MKNKRVIKYIISIALWILIWQAVAVRVDMELFLPTPVCVFSLFVNDLITSADFWDSIAKSMMGIGSGFGLGITVGIVFAVLSYIFEIVEIMLWFPIRIIRSVPVASFVILILLWVPASYLSAIIPFMMVVPIIYSHTLTSLKETNIKLLEMAKLFGIPWYKQIRYIYMPQIVIHIVSASSLAAGLAWKSGIAAEIIGLVQNSIGNRLYQAKIYLLTPELFAWTMVIVILSIIFEQMMKLLVVFITKESGDKK